MGEGRGTTLGPHEARLHVAQAWLLSYLPHQPMTTALRPGWTGHTNKSQVLLQGLKGDRGVDGKQ